MNGYDVIEKDYGIISRDWELGRIAPFAPFIGDGGSAGIEADFGSIRGWRDLVSYRFTGEICREPEMLRPRFARGVH